MNPDYTGSCSPGSSLSANGMLGVEINLQGTQTHHKAYYHLHMHLNLNVPNHWGRQSGQEKIHNETYCFRGALEGGIVELKATHNYWRKTLLVLQAAKSRYV